MLELKHVSKTFNPGTEDAKTALDDLSLSVADGDFITIIGANGAGKSTLFGAICGTFLTDSGSIFLDGENITMQPQHRRSRVIGHLFQDPMRGSAPGMSIEENAAEIDKLRHNMCQVFTVDDLKYLRGTGRLSSIKAAVASVLNIKPLLKGDTEGKIVCFEKTRGRNNAIKALAQQYDEMVREPYNQCIGIAHADCTEDAEQLIELLNRNNPPHEIMLVCYEPVTGSHVGPGTLALFFLGSDEFRSK